MAANNNNPKTYPIYDDEVTQPLPPEVFELKEVPLEKTVRSVRLWCCMVERKCKATFFRMKETTINTETKLGNELSKLTWTKRPEFRYGVIASFGIMGFLLARMRYRRFFGQVMYTVTGAGLAWGGYHIAEPTNRRELVQALQTQKRELYSWTEEKYKELQTKITKKLKNGSATSGSKSS